MQILGSRVRVHDNALESKGFLSFPIIQATIRSHSTLLKANTISVRKALKLRNDNYRIIDSNKKRIRIVNIIISVKLGLVDI